MKNLKALRKVSLSAFGKVPEFVGELKDLTELDISHNRLNALPDFIENMKKLRTLNLHSTWIRELPEWVGNLKNLVDLDISNNDIVVNPKNVIKKLHKLKEYDDCYNKFDSEDSNSKELEIPSFDL
jgi:Leucine-rich repeat (LRR) protein